MIESGLTITIYLVFYALVGITIINVALIIALVIVIYRQ